MKDAFICYGKRPPIGRHGGGLAGVRPDDLAGNLIAKVVEALIAELSDVDKWVQADPKGAAAQLSASTGILAPVVELALARQSSGIKPISREVVAAQDIADTFHALGLLPKPITISEAVWKAGS